MKASLHGYPWWAKQAEPSRVMKMTSWHSSEAAGTSQLKPSLIKAVHSKHNLSHKQLYTASITQREQEQHILRRPSLTFSGDSQGQMRTKLM